MYIYMNQMKWNDFKCSSLCVLGALTSAAPRRRCIAPNSARRKAKVAKAKVLASSKAWRSKRSKTLKDKLKERIIIIYIFNIFLIYMFNIFWCAKLSLSYIIIQYIYYVYEPISRYVRIASAWSCLRASGRSLLRRTSEPVAHALSLVFNEKHRDLLQKSL